jgi:hypothetical protein
MCFLLILKVKIGRLPSKAQRAMVKTKRE